MTEQQTSELEINDRSYWQSFKSAARLLSASLISKIPLIGRLSEVPGDARAEARSEIAWTTFFGTMPFWVPPLLGSIFFLERTPFWSSIRDGELFVYASAFVGPLVYIVTKRFGRFKVPIDSDDENLNLTYPFPYARVTTVSAAIICFLSAVIFTLHQISSISDFKRLKFINEDGIAYLSVAVFVYSTLLMFCATAYRNMLESLDGKHSDLISNALPEQEQDIDRLWRERRNHD